MPFRSKSQIRKFRILEKEGKLKKGTTSNWLKETKNIKSLPMRLKKKTSNTTKSKMAKYSLGGGVGDDPKSKKKNTSVKVGTGEDKVWEGDVPAKVASKQKDEKTYIKNKEGKEEESISKGYYPDVHSAEYKKQQYDAVKAKYKELNAPKKTVRKESVYIKAPVEADSVETEKNEPTPIRMPAKKKPFVPAASAEFDKDGGVVTGKGTGKSDSNPAKVKKGSFIIPSGIRSKLANMLMKGKKANMNQKGGKPVMLSKGEEVVEPDDAKEIDEEMKEHGVKKGINMLAPKSKKKFNRNMFVKKK